MILHSLWHQFNIQHETVGEACTSMLWISTRAGCPAEGRLGRTWTRCPPGPKRAQRWGMVNFSGVAGRGGAAGGQCVQPHIYFLNKLWAAESLFEYSRCSGALQVLSALYSEG